MIRTATASRPRRDRSFGDRNFRRWLRPSRNYSSTGRGGMELDNGLRLLVRFAWRAGARTHDRAGSEKWERPTSPSRPTCCLQPRQSTLGESLPHHSGAFQRRTCSKELSREFADAHAERFQHRIRRRDAAGAGRRTAFLTPNLVQIYISRDDISRPRPRDARGRRMGRLSHGRSEHTRGSVSAARRARPHPRRWRPHAVNRHFLGFYRLKILR